MTLNSLDEAHIHGKVKDDGRQALKHSQGRGEANQVSDHCLGSVGSLCC